MQKSIIIIGAGMGGMAAGIYGQMNGYKTSIFEMHYLPGGQCASWSRNGYTFDVCIHHLMGCSPASRINRLWRELGVMPRELVYPRECVSAASPDGKRFIDYYDLERLEEHLLQLAPRDEKTIREYVAAVTSFTKKNLMEEMIFGSLGSMLMLTPALLKSLPWFRNSMSDFSKRFSDPFLQRAFPLLEYSMPEVPFAIHLAKHACGYHQDIAWPAGGSGNLARSMAKHYERLGGKIYYRQKVAKILVKNDKAVGIRLEDGTEEYADIIISNADGRKTLLDMLEGKYLGGKLGEYTADNPDEETNWAVHVFLGVNRDLSQEPSSMIMLLNEPVILAGHEAQHLEMQIYGFDKSMAPEGKGVIKVELFSKYSYWKRLAVDRAAYDEEKQKIAAQVIVLLENCFPGIKNQVEAVDVPTLLTWERFMGGTRGFANTPNKKMSLTGSLMNNSEMLVPGLENFYFAGVWATSAGALFMNALSGQKAIKAICSKDGRKFNVPV